MSRYFRLVWVGAAILGLLVSEAAIAMGKKKPAGPSRSEVASAETSKVTHLLSRPGDPIWFPEMLTWMAARAKEPVTAGNSLELLQDGTEFFPRRLELIRRARRSIDLTTFLWCDDQGGLAVARELAAAAARGVRVRIMISFFNFKPSAQVERILKGAGIQLLTVNPPFWGWDLLQDVNHEKIMVVDGRESLVGGANLCDEYLTGASEGGLWREMELHSTGPVNRRIQERFDDTWNIMATTDKDVRCGYDSLFTDTSNGYKCRPGIYSRYPHPTPSDSTPSGRSGALFVYQQPYLTGDYIEKYRDAKTDSENARALYSALISRAKRRLVLYIPYLCPPDDVLKAIQDAARRGVRVIVFTNSYRVNDLAKPLAGAATSYYRPLLGAGVEIHEFWHRTLHAKALLVDDTTAVVGSHNLTARTFKSRGESAILTDDARVIAAFDAGARRDLEVETRQVTLQNLSQMRPDAGNALLNALGRLLRDFI